MPIIATPENATELTQLRTLRGKVFDIGNGKRRLITKLGRVHFRNDSNQLDDIELTTEVESGTGEIVANKLPYRFRLRTTGIGFDYQSREDGLIVRKALTRVGNTNIDQNATFAYTINGNRIRFADVGTNLDVVFQIGRSGVQTFWICKTASAPKTVRWANEYDLAARPKISDIIRGRDNLNGDPREGNDRRPLNVSFSDGNATLQPSGRWRFIRTETWTGETQVIDPVTHIKSWTNEVIYPAAIDPDITEEIGLDSDDGFENGGGSPGNWYTTTQIYWGSNWDKPGWRFQTVAVPQGATIDLANLKVNVTGSLGSGFSSGTLFGADIDDSATWSNTNGPSDQTPTTASASFPRPTGTGIHTIDVTSIVQEIVNRGGWASGNDLSIFGDDGEASRYTKIEDLSASGAGETNEAQLEIDYTEGGGGGGTAALDQGMFIGGLSTLAGGLG